MDTPTFILEPKKEETKAAADAPLLLLYIFAYFQLFLFLIFLPFCNIIVLL